MNIYKSPCHSESTVRTGKQQNIYFLVTLWSKQGMKLKINNGADNNVYNTL